LRQMAELLLFQMILHQIMLAERKDIKMQVEML